MHESFFGSLLLFLVHAERKYSDDDAGKFVFGIVVCFIISNSSHAIFYIV